MSKHVPSLLQDRALSILLVESAHLDNMVAGGATDVIGTGRMGGTNERRNYGTNGRLELCELQHIACLCYLAQ